jgi:hypothetical protein
MKTPVILKIAPVVLLLSGCVHQHFLKDKCVIYDTEIAAWRKSALDAINSPDEWKRVGIRISTDPIPVPFTDNLTYNLYQSRPDTVEAVARLPMKRFQERGYCVRVIMGRSSACVLSMREEYYY